MTGFKREVAYRVFAKELRRTDIVLERDEEDTYAPQYIMTPTGAKVNRVFVIGALTEIEDIGQEQEYWKARLQDATGTFTTYAGQYNAEAAMMIAQVEIPEILGIIGKIDVYTPQDGGTVVSLRPETVAVVSKETRDRWTYQTAIQTMNRIREFEAGNPDSIADMKPYRQMVRDAYKEVE